jgi:hypothetical protein
VRFVQRQCLGVFHALDVAVERIITVMTLLGPGIFILR